MAEQHVHQVFLTKDLENLLSGENFVVYADENNEKSVMIILAPLSHLSSGKNY